MTNNSENGSDRQLFITSTGTIITGIRMDQILSFTFNEPELSLSVRYVGDPNPEKFQGPMAQAILRELRYMGRK